MTKNDGTGNNQRKHNFKLAKNGAKSIYFDEKVLVQSLFGRYCAVSMSSPSPSSALIAGARSRPPVAAVL